MTKSCFVPGTAARCISSLMRLPIEGLMASPGFKRLEDALTAIAPSGSFPPYIDGVLLMLEGISPGGVDVHPGG